MNKQALREAMIAEGMVRAAAPALPRARRNTRPGAKFRRDVYKYMYDYIEEALQDVPQSKRSELLNDYLTYDMDKLESQEEVVQWLQSTDRRGFLGYVARWKDDYGAGQAGMVDDVMRALKGLGRKKILLALVVADLHYKYGDNPSKIYDDVRKGLLPKDNLVAFLKAVQWASKLNLPKGVLAKQARQDLQLEVNLPNYSRGDIDEFLERPLKWLERDYKMYVLTGVGDVPYLSLAPKRDDEDFVEKIRRDFNKIVNAVIDLYANKGVRVSGRDVVRSVNAKMGNQPLLKVLRSRA